MTDVRIARFKRHYRMPADALNERVRIDRVFKSAVADDIFDAALERAGLDTTDHVCIRHVQSRVRLNAGVDDSKLAVECSVALADAIALELSLGGSNVVRYGSIVQALIDMAISIAQGKLERAWAWRRLELWYGDETGVIAASDAQLFTALINHAETAPHILALLGDAGLLEGLAVRVPDAQWIALASAVLTMAGVRDFGALLGESHIGDDVGPTDNVGDSGRVTSRAKTVAARVVRQSRVLTASGIAYRTRSASVARALAVLAVVECEPTTIHEAGAAEIIRRIVEAATQELHRTPTDASQPQEADALDEPVDTRFTAVTQFGGLLFLLHAVRALRIYEMTAERAVFHSRALKWVLHELAVLLLRHTCDNSTSTDALRRDGAAAAFSGQHVSATAALVDEPPATPAEIDVLQALSRDIAEFVRARGGALEHESDSETLRRVILRPATIVADAAWIDVRLSFADVSTDVRRAGLDLNLGWLPWLGVVVRFSYA